MIGFDRQLVSKVLIFEDVASAQVELKALCAEYGLIGLKQAQHSAMNMLESNIDLGAVLISESCTDPASGIADGFALARHIHQLRRELPIFIRREGRSDLDDLSPEARKGIAGAYDIEHPESFKLLLDQYLADTEYPISLIRRIEEITHSSLNALFRDIEVSNELPYLVKDKLTYGDILSLLPVEAPWFSGYMMVQSEEQPMLELIKDGRTSIDGTHVDFRDVMGMLSEITNLAWGGCAPVYSPCILCKVVRKPVSASRSRSISTKSTSPLAPTVLSCVSSTPCAIVTIGWPRSRCTRSSSSISAGRQKSIARLTKTAWKNW